MNYILPYLGDMQDMNYKHCFITIYHLFRECFSFTNFIILISQILKILLMRYPLIDSNRILSLWLFCNDAWWFVHFFISDEILRRM